MGEAQVAFAIVVECHVRIHIVTAERIQFPIVIDIHEVGPLAEDVLSEIHDAVGRSVIVRDGEGGTATTSVDQVIVPVAVDITCSDAP